MNYKKIYNNIINNRLNNPCTNNTYTEEHHITPKSLGGSDDKTNLVKLTAREHFICHFLLSKMFPKETFEWYKMNHAFIIMKCNSSTKRYFNSRLYESRRKYFSTIMSQSQAGYKNSQYNTMWVSNLETEETKKVSKDMIIKYPWVKGRNKKMKKCIICGDKFHPDRKGKFCSERCKQVNIERINKEKINAEHNKIKNIINESNYDIEQGSISKNKDLIKLLIKQGCQKRSILLFFGCGDSGPMYDVLNKVLKSK